MVLLLALQANALAQQAELRGYIKGFSENRLSIRYSAGDGHIVDTIMVKEGRFKWTAPMAEPQEVLVALGGTFFSFFASGTPMKLTGSADSLHNLKVTGSPAEDESRAFHASLKDIEDRSNELSRLRRKAPEAELAAIDRKYANLNAERAERYKQYIAAHPGSLYSLYLVERKAVIGEYNEVKALYNLLADSVRNTAKGGRLAARLETLRNSAIGAAMPDFTQDNVAGEPVSFSEYRGKYVLVDFWASWCGPCRAENGRLLTLYSKYKDRGFTVLGISLDDNREAWEKAVKEDKLPWMQLSDLNGEKNALAVYFGIQAIPNTLLVDPEGRIIAKNLRGGTLSQKLAELFD